MDEAVIKQIQREGADALLDIGVSVPLKAFHIPFRKSPLELRVDSNLPLGYCISSVFSLLNKTPSSSE